LGDLKSYTYSLTEMNLEFPAEYVQAMNSILPKVPRPNYSTMLDKPVYRNGFVLTDDFVAFIKMLMEHDYPYLENVSDIDYPHKKARFAVDYYAVYAYRLLAGVPFTEIASKWHKSSNATAWPILHERTDLLPGYYYDKHYMSTHEDTKPLNFINRVITPTTNFYTKNIMITDAIYYDPI
jgi:hypothetical protein